MGSGGGGGGGRHRSSISIEAEIEDEEDDATRSARRTHERFHYSPHGGYVPLRSNRVAASQLDTVIKHDVDGD